MNDRPLSDQSLANLLGQIIIDWNYLESMVKALVYDLAVFHSEAFEDNEPFHVLFVLLGNSDLRTSIASAKALAFDLKDDRFYDKLEKVLNWIDNELRNERNRCVHDIWQVTGTMTKRVRQGVTVRKTKGSGERKLLMGSVREYASEGELRELLNDIQEANEAIDDLIVRVTIKGQR